MDYSERSISSWKYETAPLLTGALHQHLVADVCVVGAGMAGLSVAYELACAGKRVVVLDDNAVGGGETAQSTAHIASAIDDRFSELERVHGEAGARLAYESHAAAVDRIESIVRDERIDCGFMRVNGYLFLAPGQMPDLLDRELVSATRAGFHDAQLLTRAPDAPFDTGPCILFPRQAQFHPLRYVAGLLRAIQRRGGMVFTNTHVDMVQDAHEQEMAAVTTSAGFGVSASAVVVATNTPINDRFAIHTKQAAHRSYVVAFNVPSAGVRPALYWDAGDPYHYVRWHLSNDAGDEAMLMVGGEDHPTGHDDDPSERFARLITWTRERFPDVGQMRHCWSGQVMEPVDSLAFIGRNPGDKHVFIVTGDSGNGITHGAIAGMLIRDLVSGTQNAWQALYEPSRKHLTLPDLARTGIQAIAAYAQWLGVSSMESLQDLQHGEGRVVQHGLKKLAVYRERSGALKICSAACPHLGGLVHWNTLERSWDCPVHGSRFDVDGNVLNGPACTGLEPVRPEVANAAE